MMPNHTQALEAIDTLRDYVDTLLIVSNDRLLQQTDENTPLKVLQQACVALSCVRCACCSVANGSVVRLCGLAVAMLFLMSCRRGVASLRRVSELDAGLTMHDV